MFSIDRTVTRSSRKASSGVARGVEVLAAKHVGRLDAAGLVHEPDRRVRFPECNRGLDQPAGTEGPGNGHGIDAAVGPLTHEQRRHVGRVVVVQMSEEHAGNLPVVDAGLLQSRQRAVAAIDQIGLPAGNDHVGGFAARRGVVRATLGAEQHQPRAGVRDCGLRGRVLATGEARRHRGAGECHDLPDGGTTRDVHARDPTPDRPGGGGRSISGRASRVA